MSAPPSSMMREQGLRLSLTPPLLPPSFLLPFLVKAAIKKAGHSRQNKPYSLAVEGIPSRAAGEQLVQDFGRITSDTTRMHKRMLGPDEVEAWLGIDEVEHVKYTGRVWAIEGTRP